jgi:myo-inositol-1(or 4)-monophosphatase
MKLDLELTAKQVVNLCRAVGVFIKKQAGKIGEDEVEYKGVHNLVTYVDKTAEKMLVGELEKIFPQAGYIAEEDSSLQRKERFNWIIDPLDGTTNFIHSLPVYSISVALADKEDIILGVVYEINLNEAFYAWKGSPAFLNGKQVKVSSTDNLDKSLIATGFPYSDYSLLDSYLELFKDLMKISRGVRRLGSAAVDLAYVAAGRFDLFYEYGLNPWDVAAGAFVVKQAGGNVTDFGNGTGFVFGKEIVASNGIIHNDFLNVLTKYFGDNRHE